MARDFDGTNDRLIAGANTELNLTGDMTISCLINSDALVSTRAIMGKAAAAAIQYELEITSGGIIRARIGNGASTTDTSDSTTTVATGAWRHVGAWYDWNGGAGTDVAAIIDGVKEGSGTKGIVMATGTATAKVAEGFEGRFDGKIAELGIWDVALTVDEIAALGKRVCPAAIRPGNLVSYTALVRDITDRMGAAAWVATEGAVDVHPRVLRPYSARRPVFNQAVAPVGGGGDAMLLGMAG